MRDIAGPKQCAYTQTYCTDEDGGILSYFSLYYCQLAKAQPLALIILLAWLGFLFSSLGIIAGVFLAVNLGSIAQDLHMSDTLAGVTFLALGNGAPDIFSTIAAMKKSSNNLALGELIGAAAFITGVITGSMALIRQFDVVKISLIRDTVFLLGTMAFLLCILIDGSLRLWHCIIFVVIYVVYILVVAGWHWWQSRQSKQERGDQTAPESIEDCPNAHPSRETEPLLSQHDDLNNIGDYRAERQRHQHPGRAPRIWDEEEWYNPNAEIVNYRHCSGAAMEAIYRRHWAQHHDTRTSTPTHNRNRHHWHEGQIPNATSIADSTGRRTSGKPDSLTKSRNIMVQAFRDLVPIHDEEGEPGRLLIAGHMIMLPMTLALRATTPRVTETPSSDHKQQNDDDGSGSQESSHEAELSGSWNRWLTALQCFTAPQFMAWLVARQLSKTASDMFFPCMICLVVSTALAALILLTSSSTPEPRWYRLLCIPGFIVSVAWISTLADEIVAVLKILGVISNIPDAIMGLTVFAMGNSIDDWAANLSVARDRHPVMALGACFGGPLLNILLGLSISGISVIVRGAKAGHGLVALDLKPSRSLFIVVGTTMLNLGLLLVLIRRTGWRMTKLTGYVLTGVWLGSTVLNVVLVVVKG